MRKLPIFLSFILLLVCTRGKKIPAKNGGHSFLFHLSFVFFNKSRCLDLVKNAKSYIYNYATPLFLNIIEGGSQRFPVLSFSYNSIRSLLLLFITG